MTIVELANECRAIQAATGRTRDATMVGVDVWFHRDEPASVKYQFWVSNDENVYGYTPEELIAAVRAKFKANTPAECDVELPSGRVVP